MHHKWIVNSMLLKDILAVATGIRYDELASCFSSAVWNTKV